MKKYYLLSAALLMILSACRQDKPEKNPRTYRVEHKQVLYENPSYFTIELNYPLFVTEGEEELNLEPLNTAITSFLDTAAVYYWGTDTTGAKQVIDEAEAAGTYQLLNTYEIPDTTNHLISVKLETYSFALGAHGFTAIHTYNYSTCEQKMLDIQDVLDLSSTEKILHLNQLLLKHFENPEDCFNQDPTADSDFTRFALTEDEVIFYYEAYELGAYYCGMAEIRIPVAELEEAGLWKFNSGAEGTEEIS